MREITTVTLVLVLTLIATTTANAAIIDPTITDMLATEGEVPVIIMLKEPVQSASNKNNNAHREVIQNQIHGRQDAVLSKLALKQQMNQDTAAQQEPHQSPQQPASHDLALRRRFSMVNAFSGNVTSEGLTKLQNDPDVAYIYHDAPVQATIADSIPLINASTTHSHTINSINMTGRSQTICIIDTGINYTHADLGSCSTADMTGGTCSKVLNGWDFVNNDDDPADDHGHGTHVAGIAAANGSTSGSIRGVAPDAKIIAIKALDNSGSGLTSDVIASIDWCANNATKYSISVISMSLGGGAYTGYCDSDDAATAAAINNAVGNNISVVAATGNTGSTTTIASPACIINATAVTSTTKSDGISSFSDRNSITDLAAPGSSINSTDFNGDYSTKSGTSMATPHVAGAIALINQFATEELNTNPTPANIETTLKGTGINISDSGTGLNFSRIDVYTAMLSLDTTAPQLTLAAPTPDNASTTTSTNITINITSHEPLQNITLEWNGANESMNETVNTSSTGFSVTKTDLSDATYSFRIHAVDRAGNTNTTENRTVTVATAPGITIIAPANNSYHRTPFILNVSITASTISETKYNITNTTDSIAQNSSSPAIAAFNWTDTINISNSSIADGNYTLTVAANTTAGTNTTAIAELIIDKTAPALFAINRTPLTAYNNDTLVFRINVTDISLNTSTIIFETNITGDWINTTMTQEAGDRYNITRTNLTNGQAIEYRFHATDHAGNTNISETFNFTVQNRIPTSINITFPANSTVIEAGTTTTFNATASDQDNDALTYTWSALNTTTTGQNVTLQLNTSSTLTVTLNVSDGFSSNTTTVEVIINDTLPPNITLSYLSEVHLSRDVNQTANITAHDPSGIFNVTLLFNNTTQPYTTQSGSFYGWSWNNLNVGSYNFTINATDNTSAKNTNTTTHTFSVTSCTDSTQNGDETGTDCGGSCSACSTGDDGSGGGGSGGSSGGGGGGGSGSSGGSTTTTATTTKADISKSHQWDTASAGDILSMNIANAAIAVSRVDVTTANTLSSVKVTVGAYTNTPNTVPELDNTYQYLEMTAETGTISISADDISSAAITFSINSAWLAAGNYDPDTVTLHRYADSWTALPTRKSTSENTYIATTPGFSYFAITAAPRKEQAITALEAETVEGDESATAQIQESIVDAQKGISGAAVAPPIQKRNWIVYTAVLITLITFVIIMTIRRSRRKQAHEWLE
jgi:PGF-pre-PGF domain-containing protein